MKSISIFVTAFSVSILCGCASLVDDVRAWAEIKAQNLAPTIHARTPLPPRNRSFLIGSWDITQKSFSKTIWTPPGTASDRVVEDRLQQNLTYRFYEDGTFLGSTIVSGSALSSRVSSSFDFSGTWSYENGRLTTIREVPRTGTITDHYDVLWYGNEEFELRAVFASPKEERDSFEKALQPSVTGRNLVSFERSCSDVGVAVAWHSSSDKWGREMVMASVSLPSIAKRRPDSPRISSSPHCSGSVIASFPQFGKPLSSEKWRRVEKTELEEYQVRIVYELSDGVSIEEADRELNPLLREEQRDSFRRRNQEVDPESIHASADYETRNGGRTLVYTVSAFTTQPTLLEMAYHNTSRRGSCSYRINAHGNADAAFEYAKQEIANLALHENVVLEVGKKPPPGAKYRLLDQAFQDGVLTIEFELIE